MTLTEFLIARIADDEAVANAAQPGPWHPQGGGQVMLPPPWTRHPWTENAVVEAPVSTSGRQGQADANHIARHDPARVLAECEAKRQIVERCEHWLDAIEGMEAEFILAALAQPYADHPDFDPAWRLA